MKLFTMNDVLSIRELRTSKPIAAASVEEFAKQICELCSIYEREYLILVESENEDGTEKACDVVGCDPLGRVRQKYLA